MARPIQLTEALIRQMVEEFSSELKKLKVSDGKVSYVRSITYPDKKDRKATVMFEPLAYAKMLMLLHEFSSEVGWHGTVERIDDYTYVVNDIFVYPQVVTGATVNTDQERYQKWLMEMDDDTANSLHLHGHSHVNMSTVPSTVDDTHRNELVSMLGPDNFYIFMIWNKRLEHNIKIFDMRRNICFEDSEINVGLRCENGDLTQFVKDSKEMAVTKTYTKSQFPVSANVAKNSTKDNKSKGANGKKSPDYTATPLTDYAYGYEDDDGYPPYGYGYGRGYYGAHNDPVANAGTKYKADGTIDYDAEIFDKDSRLKKEAPSPKKYWWGK